MTDAMRDLIAYMHELSRDHWDASWARGLEVELWRCINDGQVLHPDEIDELKRLREAAAGWPLMRTPDRRIPHFTYDWDEADYEHYYQVFTIPEWENKLMEELL